MHSSDRDVMGETFEVGRKVGVEGVNGMRCDKRSRDGWSLTGSHVLMEQSKDLLSSP